MPDDASSVVAFYAVLPLCNAAFDFLSVGVTRYALRHALEAPRLTWVIALLDLLAAAALFLGLKITAVLLLLGFNMAAGGGPTAGLVDLPTLLDDIEGNPHAYWWLYLGFMTTLLPTFFHVFVGLWSVGGWLPRSAGRWLAMRAPHFEEDRFEQLLLWLGATVYATIAVALPVLVGWYAWLGVVWAYPQAGGALLDIARWLLETASALHGGG
ncbi:MAG: hypothetical protein AAF371_10710 [Pseudomonadota bacterium]